MQPTNGNKKTTKGDSLEESASAHEHMLYRNSNGDFGTARYNVS